MAVYTPTNAGWGAAMPKPIPKPPVYKPTNPGWGAAGLGEKLAALNPSGSSTLGWGQAQGDSYWSQPNVENNFTPGRPAPSNPGSGGGSMPDYGALIAGDWEVKDAEAFANRMRTEGEAAFQRNLRQAFIDLGAGDTTKLGDFAKYIDAATLDAAKANKFSQLAQNLQAFTKGSAQARAALAARGMLSSGQTTKTAGDMLQAREQSDYGAGRSFLSGMNEGSDRLAQIRAQADERIAAARASAAARAAQFLSYGGGGASSGAPSSAPGRTYGSGGSFADGYAPVIGGQNPTERGYIGSGGVVNAPRYARQSDWQGVPGTSYYRDSAGNVFTGSGRLVSEA